MTTHTTDPTRIQFFIRTNSSRVFVANSTDSIRSIHERIQSSTGIPLTKQRLIYGGKQLDLDRTLSECGVQNDAELQLVCRIGSTEHAQAWQIVNDILSLTRNLSKAKTRRPTVCLKSMVVDFLNMTPQNDVGKASAHFQIFASSSAPQALVMLYSSSTSNINAADEAIREFIVFSKRDSPGHTHHHQFVPIFTEFCRWLTKTAIPHDPLYKLCSRTLRDIVECSECGEKKRVFSLQISLFRKLVAGLSRDLGVFTKIPPVVGRSPTLVKDFTNSLIHLREEIEGNLAFRDPISIPLCGEHASCTEAIIRLHGVFVDLLSKLEKWLVKIEKYVMKHGEPFHLGGGAYIHLLKVLHNISKLYSGCEDVFWEILKQRKSDFSHIVVFHAKWFEHYDYNFLLEFKESINFEARKRLSMVMLPRVKHTYEGLHEMLISRSDLLPESFEYIAHADPQSLHSGLAVAFKNEEATGHGVLREWFFLVCKEIVNPLNSLFLACPNDQRRIFPNPASGVDPLHLEYFSFCGRVIALTLMHKVQVGIVFDRVFFLQLAGRSISLEDIRDADPFLYRSCKQILEMDPEVVDQDALGLTFVHEVEEMGTKKVVELRPGGRSMVVNSKNRNEFVDSLIKHRFVTSVSKQVANFAQGFADMMSCQWCHHFFFRCLDLEDLDWMLHGNKSAVSIDDWKAHTDYLGFKETDPQISWFWENVRCMSTEKKRVLLFFWTSMKYLPVEGFRGLASRLCIYKTDESCDHLPSSRTCFRLLRLPVYRSFSVMRDRLNIITQEHEMHVEHGYSYSSSSSHMHHMDSAKTVLFFSKDLKLGCTFSIYFPRRELNSSPQLLPEHEAGSIPFSSENLQNLLQFFSFSQGSPQDVAMEDTLKQCENKPMPEETKTCATSYESMLDFTKKIFREGMKPLSLSTTHLTKSRTLLQKYKIMGVQESPAPESQYISSALSKRLKVKHKSIM